MAYLQKSSFCLARLLRQLAVILAAILGGGTLGILAKQTAEIVAVDKTAGVSDIFDFHVVAF